MANAMAEYDAIEDAPTEVKAASHSEATSQPAAIYNMGGVRMQHMQRGLNIVRTPDGKVRKYFIPRGASNHP